MSIAMLGDPVDPPRVAFAVGRSVGNAAVRNRVRRRLRAAVRDHVALLRPGHGYLVRAAANARDASFAELSGTLRALLAADPEARP